MTGTGAHRSNRGLEHGVVRAARHLSIAAEAERPTTGNAKVGTRLISLLRIKARNATAVVLSLSTQGESESHGCVLAGMGPCEEAALLTFVL